MLTWREWQLMHRQFRGWTRQELADRSGIHAETIRNAEAGRSPNLRTIEGVCKAFGLEVWEAFFIMGKVELGQPYNPEEL